MSLSIPYVLAAAVAELPAAIVRCGDDQIPISELDRRSAVIVPTLLAGGYRPGSRHTVSGSAPERTLERIASSRAGIILADVDQPDAPDEGDLDVLEQRVWSETALIETADGTLVTHGEFLAALHAGTADPAWPADLVTVVSDLLSIGSARPDRP